MWWNMLYYKFYTKKDIVIHTIELVILLLIFVPLDIWAIETMKVGSFTFFILVNVVKGYNIIYYIIAWIRYLYCKKHGMLFKPKKSFTKAEIFTIPKDIF